MSAVLERYTSLCEDAVCVGDTLALTETYAPSTASIDKAGDVYIREQLLIDTSITCDYSELLNRKP